jgi:hypothetical protein
MLRSLSLTALLIAGAAGLAQADVYRWVDAQGQPHYSDQWVPGSEVIKTSKSRPPEGGTGAAQGGDQKALMAASNRISTQIQEQDNARAVQEDKAKSQESRCKSEKDAYMRAITSRKVYKDQKDGTRTYLSDEEADAYREQLRKAVQDSCGSVPTFDPEAPLPEPQPIEPQPIPEPKVNPADATSR